MAEMTDPGTKEGASMATDAVTRRGGVGVFGDMAAIATRTSPEAGGRERAGAEGGVHRADGRGQTMVRNCNEAVCRITATRVKSLAICLRYTSQ